MDFFLHWTYIMIAGIIVALLLKELFAEERWKFQTAIVIVLIPLLMRILHIK